MSQSTQLPTENPAEASTTASPARKATLVRALGPGAAMAIVVGSVIGSGIFAKPGEIAGYVGDFRWVMAAWCVGGLFCILGGLCFAELATMLPKAGGLYVYLREAYGRPVAFLFAWCELLFVRPAIIGALAVFFVESLCRAVAIEPGQATTALLAIAAIVTLAIVNVAGVVWGGWVQLATTIIKTSFVVLLAAAPFALLLIGLPTVEWGNYATTIEPTKPTLAVQFGAALLAVMWAYNSWHVITPVAEEIRDPQHNIPLALFGGIGLLVLVYLGVNVAYHGVLTMGEMSAAGEHVAREVSVRLVGSWGGAALAAVITVSVLGAINGNLLHAPRVAFAVGRDHPALDLLASVHQNFRTPATAILVLASMASLLVATSAIVVQYWTSLKDDSIFKLLTNYSIFSASIFYCLGVLSVFVLRRRRPELPRPYRTWGYPVTPALFLGGYAWFLWQVYLDRPVEARIGLGLILLGLPIYAWLAGKSKHRPLD